MADYTVKFKEFSEQNKTLSYGIGLLKVNTEFAKALENWKQASHSIQTTSLKNLFVESANTVTKNTVNNISAQLYLTLLLQKKLKS